jgi:CDP-paratose 2-epimerase
VTVLDNLSRPGAQQNLQWLHEQCRFELRQVDVRDAGSVTRAVAETAPDVILHLAGQVAVTSSVTAPREDFEINAAGTLNLLEAMRARVPQALFIYASTNKVYGGLESLGVHRDGERYAFARGAGGVTEDQPLDFHSPYGCSKGAADAYVIDYARIYGLRTTSFRQSCIYGPRQFGIEDQGWVAWFVIAAVLERAITIYGDGMQVRDLLWVDDLIAAYAAAIRDPDACRGIAFNIGGGPSNTLSLRELVAMLEARLGHRIVPARAPRRPGDQPVFVCDVSRAAERLGWVPRVAPEAGVDRLLAWVREHRALFR